MCYMAIHPCVFPFPEHRAVGYQDAIAMHGPGLLPGASAPAFGPQEEGEGDTEGYLSFFSRFSLLWTTQGLSQPPA